MSWKGFLRMWFREIFARSGIFQAQAGHGPGLFLLRLFWLGLVPAPSEQEGEDLRRDYADAGTNQKQGQFYRSLRRRRCFGDVPVEDAVAGMGRENGPYRARGYFRKTSCEARE